MESCIYEREYYHSLYPELLYCTNVSWQYCNLTFVRIKDYGDLGKVILRRIRITCSYCSTFQQQRIIVVFAAQYTCRSNIVLDLNNDVTVSCECLYDLVFVFIPSNHEFG